MNKVICAGETKRGGWPAPATTERESVIFKFLHYLPQTVVVLVGFAYATGFLIVFTFLERFGVKEAGADFFKIKYVHVGLLALFFPVGIAAPMTVIFSLWRASRAQSRAAREIHNDETPVPIISVHLSNAILMTNMMVAFYVLVLFAEPSFFQSREFLLPSVFFLTIGGLVFINVFLKKKLAHHWAKWILVVAALLMQAWWWSGLSRKVGLIFWVAPSAIHHNRPYWIFRKWHGLSQLKDWFDLNHPVVTDFGRYCRDHLPKGGIYYVLLISLCFILARRTQIFAMQRVKFERVKTYVAGAVLIATAYFLSVLAFAYRVYPYIPAAKGGGDYTHSNRVILALEQDDLWNLPEGLFADPSYRTTTSESLVLIEQTPDVLYVARDDDEDGPSAWRNMERLPNVIEISRDELAGIIHVGHSTADSRRPVSASSRFSSFRKTSEAAER
jgi:hypothetical protein